MRADLSGGRKPLDQATDRVDDQAFRAGQTGEDQVIAVGVGCPGGVGVQSAGERRGDRVAGEFGVRIDGAVGDFDDEGLHVGQPAGDGGGVRGGQRHGVATGRHAGGVPGHDSRSVDRHVAVNRGGVEEVRHDVAASVDRFGVIGVGFTGDDRSDRIGGEHRGDVVAGGQNFQRDGDRRRRE